MPKILYAREYPIDLPESVWAGTDLVVANTPSEAIEYIKKDGDSIDGYVLGVVMVGDGVDVSELDRLWAKKHDAALQVGDAYKIDADSVDTMYKRGVLDILTDEAYEQLNMHGGESVLGCLESAGYVGHKPIMFFTSQHSVKYLADSCPKGSVEFAILPETPEILRGWFRRHFALP